ncbi:MAG: histidinol-phosphate transaminase [Anaerolineaceae bacterium]|nr:histidinol-phosphate transaminase [Anaerolineaceae bacterium]
MHCNGWGEEHGGPDPQELRKLGISPAELLDFSVNSNPFGPAPGVRPAIQAVDPSLYPDWRSGRLREALAQANQAAPGQVLVGNGAAELIWLVAQARLGPGRQALVLGPAFGEYRRAAQAVGARVEEVRAGPPDFRPPLVQLAGEIARVRPELVFVCNPNNPTGVSLPDDALQDLAATCGSDTILVMDEAYRAFRDGQFFAPPLPPNCLVLRSMTKDFALAGLRLGYALGSPALIADLARFQPAWSVNALAQAAGLAALDELDYYRATLEQLARLKVDFFSGLTTAGFPPSPAEVHFGVISVGRPAREVRHRLFQRAIQVRDCTSFGLPDFIRLSTRREADNHKLLEALQAVV